MNRMHRARYGILFAAGALMFIAFTAHAQEGGFVPLADSSQSPMLQGIYSSGNLSDYINTMFKVALSVGAILAVLRIAYAGYLYMGTDMWHTKKHATEILGEVVLGLLLLMGIYLILYQINPDILKLDLLRNLPSIKSS